MTPPPLLDGYVSPVSISASSAGIYSAARLPTLDEVRDGRLPITPTCVCGGVGTCTRCVLDGEAVWKRAEDA